MNRQPAASRNPWVFIPTLYFAEGLPYIIINTVSVILYKKMGIDNASIAFWTSWLYLPWVVKMFWGPLVDIYSTKRRWILSTQFSMAVCLFFAAYALNTEGYFFLSLSAFAVGAFVSATHDIATDGFYMLAQQGRASSVRGYPGHVLPACHDLWFRTACLHGRQDRGCHRQHSFELDNCHRCDRFCICSCAAISHIRASLSCERQ